MKILVAYFSQTGNTEEIAKAIYEEVSQSYDVKLQKIGDTDTNNINDFDLIFIGSPIHGGGLAGVSKEFLETLPTSSKIKVAGFITHSSPSFEKTNFDKGLKTFEDTCMDKNIVYLGCYECQGRLTPALHDMVKKAQNLSDNEWAERLKLMDIHPDEKDKSEAKKFVNNILSKL